MKRLLITLCLCAFIGTMFPQVLTTSSNPRAIVPTADSYLIGGKLVLQFDRPWTPYQSVILSITLDNPKVLFDTARPPVAFRDDWKRNLLTVSATEREILVRIDNVAYAGEFTSLTVEGFVLDVLDVGLKPGDRITIHLSSAEDVFTFTNSTVDLMRVGTATSRR
jgi:hypothetical protein